MRIIHDYGSGHLSIPLASSGSAGKRETVIVISEVKKSPDGASGDNPLKGKSAYDVRVSDEALALSRGVKDHEQAHMAMLAGVASSPVMYDTVRGPNGESITVGGQIAIDMAEVPGDPEATLRKARSIIQAANAPSDPSAGDMRTASRAYRMASEARAEIERKNFLV